MRTRLEHLVHRIADHSIGVDAALVELKHLPFTDLEFARVDHHRELRQGSCEFIYGRGKTVREVVAIAEAMLRENVGPILVTRADAEQVSAVRALASSAGLEVRSEPRASAVAIVRNVPRPQGLVLIVTAGTADLPVATEAALVASLSGTSVELQCDVGVAGLHRITAVMRQLAEASVVVVVAGMEGALASVIGGLADCPVIACPTSVGYGASLGGL